MMQGGFIAPNINFEHPDEYSEGLNIVNVATQKKLNTILSNSFGFGGTNSALVIKNFNK
jgi:3-oxoacyl-[acyl-carrier-protein] synthase-1